MKTKIVKGMLGTALCWSLAGCSEFIAPPESDPNAVPDANVNQLFVAHQANLYLWHGGTAARFNSIWMQHMGGVARQSADHERYDVNEGDFTPMWEPAYQQGGLIDLRNAQERAQEAGWSLYLGILQIHEAYLIGMMASIFGDIPYSEAANPEISEPVLDSQSSVYSAVQSLLDQAITNLASGQGVSPGGNDFNFGGDAASWMAVAHTLKARFNLHWVEVDGISRYQAALTEAQQGISSIAGNWTQIHTTNSNEANPWFLWTAAGRAGDIVGNATIIDMMNGGTPNDPTDDDPRTPSYWLPAIGAFAGQIIGHSNNPGPGDPGVEASYINIPGQSNFNQPIVTCTETQFIIAEALSALGDDAGARAAAKDALACQEAFWGVDLSALKADFDAVSGTDLFNLIMQQKFVSLFLEVETWNDFKRTCQPVRLPTAPANVIPGRWIYAQQERQTNSNVPEPSQAPARNANDPNAC